VAFAQHIFELEAPQKADGRPLREHLQAAYRQTGRLPQMLLDAPELPEGCEPLWRDFLSLHSMRGSTGFGASRIGIVEIDAYQRVHGVRFAHWQLEAIRRADIAFLNIKADTDKGRLH
jgi:hypothetical protein